MIDLLLGLALLASVAAILPIERQIATSPVEIGVGIDRNGVQRWVVTGDENGIDTMTIRQGNAIRGGTFTHVHPGADHCVMPSVDDIQSWAFYHIRELRTVGYENGVVTVAIVRNPRWLTYEAWNRAFDRHADLEWCARGAAAFADLGYDFERISG